MTASPNQLQPEAATPQEIHGDGSCHICGKPIAGAGSIYCSYPHGMVPDESVGGGMWTWKHPEPRP